MDKNTETTPIENIICLDSALLNTWSTEYQRLVSGLEPPLVGSLKRFLGPHTRTWVGGSENRRFWIWESADSWRIFASNIRGLTFEVLPHLTQDQAMQAWSKVVALLSRLRIVFIINGENVPVEGVAAGQPLSMGRQKALAGSHNTGRPPEEWEIRDEAGRHMKRSRAPGLQFYLRNLNVKLA